MNSKLSAAELIELRERLEREIDLFGDESSDTMVGRASWQKHLEMVETELESRGFASTPWISESKT